MKRYQQTLEWLFSQLPMYQRVGAAAYKPDLSSTEALMALLNHPEKGLRCVHVGGTNGKGSVSHMLAAVFQEAGYKTGLYTSPHLKDFRERIKINGQMISQEAVVDFTDRYRKQFEELGLSFFEMTVGMAFNYFREEQTDIAIIEVGMGGRLDSTNVVNPELSIITNVSFDHMQYLGDTRTKIAREKAGIIKPGKPVLIGERDSETVPVYREIAKEQRAPLYFAPEMKGLGHVKAYPVDADYQFENLRTTTAAVQLLAEGGFNLKGHAPKALANFRELTGLRGRWETLSNQPRIVCDTAHNEAGVQRIVDQLKKEDYRQLHIIWGVTNDKELGPILRLLPKSAIYYFCRPDIPRGLAAEELQSQALRFGLSGKTYPSAKAALETAKKVTFREDFIYVGGSNFVVAEVL